VGPGVAVGAVGAARSVGATATNERAWVAPQPGQYFCQSNRLIDGLFSQCVSTDSVVSSHHQWNIIFQLYCLTHPGYRRTWRSFHRRTARRLRCTLCCSWRWNNLGRRSTCQCRPKRRRSSTWVFRKTE